LDGTGQTYFRTHFLKSRFQNGLDYLVKVEALQGEALRRAQVGAKCRQEDHAAAGAQGRDQPVGAQASFPTVAF